MGLKSSQRIGKTPVRTTLQVEGMDKGLKNGLWNCIAISFKKMGLNKERNFYTSFCLNYQEETVEELRKNLDEFERVSSGYFGKTTWTSWKLKERI